MEDLQSFKIKSSVHDYEVRFEYFDNSIKEIVNEGDFIIADPLTINRSWLFDSKEFNNCNVLYIRASEHAKEYKKVAEYIDEIIVMAALKLSKKSREWKVEDLYMHDSLRKSKAMRLRSLCEGNNHTVVSISRD